MTILLARAKHYNIYKFGGKDNKKIDISNFFGLFYPNYCYKKQICGQKPPTIEVVIDGRVLGEEVEEPYNASCQACRQQPKTIETM